MDTLAKPVVSFVSENIGRLLREEAQFLAGVSGQVEQLQSKLELLLSLLRDADSRQDQDELFRRWISQSKDLAYDAENVVENFAFKVASRRGKGFGNFLKRYSCILSECYIRHRVGSEIQSLHCRISDLTKSFRQYGIRDIMEREGPSLVQQQLMRRTYSHTEDEDFVGSENDVKLLVKHLTDKHEVSSNTVVSIFGMGGLGKTTIARKVYYHPDVRNHFDAYAWVCISQQWQTKTILQELLVKIMPENERKIVKEWTQDQLVGHLYNIQQSKIVLDDRSIGLIVLDDIWSTDAWECLKNAFPTTKRSESKILLTTRNRNVAIHIGPNGFHHEPRLLSHDESWTLLVKKALKGRHSHDHGFEDIRRFEELGNEMVKCTGGLPLAVVVLGGILATKQGLNEWNFVYRNIKSFLGKDENIGQSGGVENILALSYNDLPYQLKPCFLYLSIYPEDWDIETETLYKLWMAEGMVSEKHRIGGESTMDVAERYLIELATRCMIQVSLKTGPAIRKFKSCRLHDLMRDMCLAKARDENFVKIVDYGQENHPALVDANSSRNKCHRMVILLNKKRANKYVLPDREMIKHIRSLAFRGTGVPRDDDGIMGSAKFNSFKMLRALTIEGWSPDYMDNLCDCIYIFLKSWRLEIGNLIHLRYLCVRDSLPFLLRSSLGNLKHLETLDLRGYRSRLLFMGNVMCKMKNLRHLYLNDNGGNFMHPFLNDGGGSRPMYGKLRFFGLTKLEILENFDPEYCEIKDLCKLSNLQVLKVVRVEDECEQIINFISNSQCLKLVNLNVLLSCGFSLALVEMLFCSNLHHLYLKGLSRGLPEYKPHFFQHLVELELKNFQTESMGTLENLPNLHSLWLRDGIFGVAEIICPRTGFPQLRFLSLCRAYRLREWRVESGAMANLSRLVIDDCPYLKMIPDGLQFVTKLKELEIRGMPQSFYDRIGRDGVEGEDFHKVRHVPSIVFS